MKTFFLPSLKLSLLVLILVSVIYPVFIMLIGKLSPGGGDGVVLYSHGKKVGYALIGQKFTDDKYFWSRPSAVDYKADGSGGSNKAPSNPDYLKDVESRIQNFLKHNPGIKRSQIPAELVTASGSGLDPDLSLAGARIQVPRLAHARGISEAVIFQIIDKTEEKPLLGFLGPEKVNVLKLNIALDAIK
jgi:K+-transporting ATPase ATPase C chain